MRSRHARLLCAAGLSWAAAVGVAQAGEFLLEPYQMVQSLQMVQDRLAAGDATAMPMQRTLLEMIDHRLKTAKPGEFKDPRNFRALLFYGMSGGNPATFDHVLSEISLGKGEQALADGVRGYVDGRPADAMEDLKDVDPLKLEPLFGAFIALIRGSVAVTADPAEAQKMFDLARLLAPGTLVEEAALRRSIIIATRQKDKRRFLHESEDYVRRFVGSPYASQFVDTFVSGVADFDKAISFDEISGIVSIMDSDRQNFVYLRLAREGAIEGKLDLARFASKMAESTGGPGAASDPRALLYSGAAAVTSGNVLQALDELRKIDRSALSSDDRKLLDAALAVASEVTAEPTIDVADAAPKAKRGGSGGEPKPAAMPVSASPNFTQFVDHTREKLAAVDKLLEGATP